MKHVIIVGPRPGSPSDLQASTRLVLTDSKWALQVVGKLAFLGHNVALSSEPASEVEFARDAAELLRRDALMDSTGF